MDHPSTEFESGRFSLLTSLCQSLSVDLCKSLRKPFLDYDYIFTTPYSGSEIVETGSGADSEGNNCCLKWEECEEHINVVALASKEPILFYDEVILYEDELADSGVSLLTVKGRVAGVKVKSNDTIGARDVFIGKILSILTSDINLYRSLMFQRIVRRDANRLVLLNLVLLNQSRDDLFKQMLQEPDEVLKQDHSQLSLQAHQCADTVL
ncbi:hypothetical protein L6452_43945 [Arctium lappa]|uniref:Uncharacterized protein n=1 Tax=Arctium lappa TaxID=4217 RepID=A0ACB8XFH1_ARCLA|nr:hypothetical protein L6452_43945 [Arctium lappa]